MRDFDLLVIKTRIEVKPNKPLSGTVLNTVMRFL
jgi:hypothetical protein